MVDAFQKAVIEYTFFKLRARDTKQHFSVKVSHECGTCATTGFSTWSSASSTSSKSTSLFALLSDRRFLRQGRYPRPCPRFRQGTTACPPELESSYRRLSVHFLFATPVDKDGSNETNTMSSQYMMYMMGVKSIRTSFVTVSHQEGALRRHNCGCGTCQAGAVEVRCVHAPSLGT